MILTTTNLITDGKKKTQTKTKQKKQVIFSVNWTSKFLHALQESAKANTMHINNKNR